MPIVSRLRHGAVGYWSQANSNARGAVLLLLTALTMAVQAALVRLLAERIDSLQTIFLRGVFGVLLVLPLFMRPGVIRVRTARLPMHLARAAAGVLSMACGFYAFANMPLAEATAITFTMPLFLTLLAIVFLKELVGVRRGTATALGFVGVLVMLRPTSLTLELAALMALLSAFFHALAGILIKRLSATESVANLMLYFALMASLVFLYPAWRVWVQPTPLEWLFLFGVAFLGALSQLFFIEACRVSEMSVVAPFDYSRLIFAGLLGYLLFAEVPDAWSVVGALVIIASTLYISRREAYLARAGRLPPLAPETETPPAGETVDARAPEGSG
ncbi:MAG: DMT family transporter [Gammaproteobacteria bacterium]|nr:DMT family transporter [Gammaproteobacteria bacterium]